MTTISRKTAERAYFAIIANVPPHRHDSDPALAELRAAREVVARLSPAAERAARSIAAEVLEKVSDIPTNDAERVSILRAVVDRIALAQPAPRDEA